MPIALIDLDLSKSATRKSIFGQLVPLMGQESRATVGSVVGDVSIRQTQHFNNLAEVEAGIDRTVASATVKKAGKEIYGILAKAEAQVHGCSVEETHFHEVGDGMTVREILGICTSFELLEADRVVATKVQVGSGTVECAHGTLDIPAPATDAILKAYNIPVFERKLEGELCTPTSAAIIAYYVQEYK